MKEVPEITEEEWHNACYYAVREDFNNNLHGKKRDEPFIEKKFDKLIRQGISVFLKFDKIPFDWSIVELDSIYNCMHRRGIVDPRDPSNQQKLPFKRSIKIRRRAA